MLIKCISWPTAKCSDQYRFVARFSFLKKTPCNWCFKPVVLTGTGRVLFFKHSEEQLSRPRHNPIISLQNTNRICSASHVSYKFSSIFACDVTNFCVCVWRCRAGVASMGIGWCVAEFDYAANQPNQLSLSRGDRIAIINKAGDSRGWWKGQKDGRVRSCPHFVYLFFIYGGRVCVFYWFFHRLDISLPLTSEKKTKEKLWSSSGNILW